MGFNSAFKGLKKIKNRAMQYLSEVSIADCTVHVEHGHA